MRARSPVVLALAVLALMLAPALSVVAHASEVLLAQQTDESDEGGETTTEEGGEEGADPDEGSGSSEAETGADEGQVEEGGAGETGPPWTYQMARISIALLLLMALATGALYWRLVVQRQRRGV